MVKRQTTYSLITSNLLRNAVPFSFGLLMFILSGCCSQQAHVQEKELASPQ